MSWIAQHKLIFIVLILIIVVGVWYGLSQGGTPAPLLTTQTVDGTTATGGADQQLVGTLLALRAVALNGTIFTEPAFTSLQDFGTTIIPEPVGRENPFAPLRGRGSATSTQSAKIFTPLR